MARHLIFTIFALVLLTLALSLKFSVLSRPVQAQQDPSKINYECLGQAVAEFMNEVLANAEGLPNIRFLSPAFNLTSQYESRLFDAMVKANANFSSLDGMAGNVYTISGINAYDWFNNSREELGGRSWKQIFSQYQKPTVFTEFGDFRLGALPVGHEDRPKLINDLRVEFARTAADQAVNGINYFNAFGGNSDFAWHRLTDDELRNITRSDPAKGGVNSALPVTGGEFSQKVASLGLGWTVEIAYNPGDVENAIKAVNTLPAGSNPVIRFCSGDECPFADVQEYLKFITRLSEGVNKPVWVIVGPNEPGTEHWLGTECTEREKFIPVDVPCYDTNDPEFHKYRPYPASPCNRFIIKEETAQLCSNDLVIKQTVEVRAPPGFAGCPSLGDGKYRCEFSRQGQAVKISVNLDQAEFPILGNTELVPNFINQQNLLGFKQRVNEYVGWYLNGVTGVSTEIPAISAYNIINLSGPINKLMPLTRQFAKRIETIREAVDSMDQKITERHNQVAGCSVQNIISQETTVLNCLARNITNFFTFGKYYLSDWLGRPAKGVSAPLGIGIQTPPLEEDPGIIGSIFGWIPSYQVWHNWPGFEGWWSKLFTYIPYTSTEDRKGNLRIATIPTPAPDDGAALAPGEVKISNLTVTTAGLPELDRSQEILYFAHTEEVNEGAEYLQKTYLPKDKVDGGDTNTSSADKKNVEITFPGCQILETRTNPGDDLYAEFNEPGLGGNPSLEPGLLATVTYDARFSCEFTAQNRNLCLADCESVPSEDRDACRQACEPTCRQDIKVDIPMDSNVPLIEKIWNRLVEGDMAIFKRFFPKFGPNAPIEQVVDIPGVTTGEYIAAGADVTALAGDPTQNKPGNAAEIYFPHLGGLSEYFLKGIQTALRPKGFGELSLSGQPPPLSLAARENIVNCNKDAPAISSGALSGKDYLIKEFSREFPGNHISECYNDLVSQAAQQRYDPAFAMAIWIEESGASDYSQFPTVADFGCAVNTPKADFNAQLNCFLGLKNTYANDPRFAQCRKTDGIITMEEFLLIYSEGFQCKTGEFKLNSQFPQRIRDFYLRVTGRNLPSSP